MEKDKVEVGDIWYYQVKNHYEETWVVLEKIEETRHFYRAFWIEGQQIDNVAIAPSQTHYWKKLA